MWGAIIGAALSIGSAVAGGISSSNKRKAQRRQLEQQKRENQAWYDRKYNEDPTQRADAQRLLTQMNETIKNRNQAARGRQAVMGGTEDSVTATKEANNKTIADTTSQIVAANDARKDKIEEQYQSNKRAIENQQTKEQAESAANTAATISSVAGTAANIADAVDSRSKSATKTNGSTGTQGTTSQNSVPAGALELDNQIEQAQEAQRLRNQGLINV